MAVQTILDIHLQHLASAPRGAQPVRRHGLDRLQAQKDVIAHV